MCPTGLGCGARSRFSAAFGASKTGAGGAFFALAAGAGFADFGVSAAVFSLPGFLVTLYLLSHILSRKGG